jgi:hypothetical protein
MTKSLTRLFCHLLLLCSLLPALTGCGLVVVGGAAAGTVAYIRGDLSTTLDGSLSQSVEGVDAAIKKTGVTQVSRNVDILGAEYLLRTAQDDKVEITLEKSTDTATTIVIRVGVFGDEALSHQVLSEIRKQM